MERMDYILLQLLVYKDIIVLVVLRIAHSFSVVLVIAAQHKVQIKYLAMLACIKTYLDNGNAKFALQVVQKVVLFSILYFLLILPTK